MRNAFFLIPKPVAYHRPVTCCGVVPPKTRCPPNNYPKRKGRLLSRIGGVLIAMIVAIAPCVAAEQNGEGYKNSRMGIEFVVPDGYDLYTPEHPGPLGTKLSPGKSPFIIVNPKFLEENINVVVDEGLTESDLVEFLGQLKRMPNLSIPGYKRVSVQMISVGQAKNIRAVEHVFYMQGNIPGRVRQVTFTHKGRGITLTFATAADRFDDGNTQLLSPILASLMFLN